MPLMDAFKNVMLNETVDIKVVNLFNSMFKSIGFTDTLFVSQAGDNSNGSSWTKAYTSFKTAIDWIEDNQATGEDHLIVLGVGTWDMDITGDPTYTKNIAIFGVDRYNTIIKNDHASATSILKFENCSLKIYNIMWQCNANNHGIILDNCKGAVFVNVTGLGDSLTSAKTVLDVQNTAYFYMHDSVFAGDVAGINATVLKLDGSSRAKITGCRFWFGLKAVHLTGTGSYNYFARCSGLHSATALTIDVTQSYAHFDYVTFQGNTVNFVCNGVGCLVYRPYVDTQVIKIYPVGSNSGVNVATAVGAEAYGGWVQIVPINTITKPFRIVGFFADNGSDATAMYFMKISYGATNTEIGYSAIHGSYAELGTSNFMESDIIPANSKVSVALQSENGNDNMDFWVQYVEI